jgi:cellulose synthase/poly-beta-1,6-N-acetylglucosamine synthase-like glycosyltransferase
MIVRMREKQKAMPAIEEEEEQEELLPTPALPMIIVIMPCHRESSEVLFDSVKFFLQSDYPAHLLHLFLSFDGYENKELFLATVKVLGASMSEDSNISASSVAFGTKVTISMFEHGGKTRCQASTVAEIKLNHAEYLLGARSTFVLFLDSDTRLGNHSLRLLARTSVRDFPQPLWHA